MLELFKDCRVLTLFDKMTQSITHAEFESRMRCIMDDDFSGENYFLLDVTNLNMSTDGYTCYEDVFEPDLEFYKETDPAYISMLVGEFWSGGIECKKRNRYLIFKVEEY